MMQYMKKKTELFSFKHIPTKKKYIFPFTKLASLLSGPTEDIVLDFLKDLVCRNGNIMLFLNLGKTTKIELFKLLFIKFTFIKIKKKYKKRY